MSVKETVLRAIERTAAENHLALPPLNDDTVLLDSGLDSLAIAILVSHLEDSLGCDPFAAADSTEYPVTIGDFVRLYELAAKRQDIVASSRAGQHA
jgi:acyl carrier protein